MAGRVGGTGARRRLPLLLLVTTAAAAPAGARAQAMREVLEVPADCRSLLSPEYRGTAAPWQAFVAMGHCDRIKRLARLSALLPADEQPRFYEGIVPADRLPAEFGADIPVLRVVFPERTFFDTDRTELRPEVDAVLAIIAESLKREPPDVALFVAGHADARGARSLNERLSIDRADVLARRIFQAGVNLSSIWRLGFGSDMPLVAGATPYAWDRNRRVEFLFAAKPEAVATWLADQQLDGLCQARTEADVAQCRAKLDLKARYEAVEVSSAPRRSVAPTPAPRSTVQLDRPRRHEAAPAAARQTVSVGRPHSQIGVALDGSRRIIIDPVNQRVPPYQVDLSSS